MLLTQVGPRIIAMLMALCICLLSTESFAFIDEDRINEVAKDLRCPTCQGLSVAESSAGFADDIKKNIRLQMEKGKSNEEIIQFFRERYGLWILREPPKEGVGLLAWAAPLILLVLGPVFVWLSTFRRSRVYSAALRSDQEIMDEFLLRVKKEAF